MRINVAPKMLIWARQRARLDIETLLNKFPKLIDWEQGTVQPTLKQLEAFANKTHLPLGILFLTEPPKEELPIPDFRMMGTTPFAEPSPDLLDTIYICQQRQEWYSNYMQIHHNTPLDFVNSVTLESDIIQIANKIRQTIKFDIEQREPVCRTGRQARTWTDALRLFVEQVENQGILVMSSGVVGSNNYRKLDPEEFRGFALVDKFAPLIFVNASDTKAAKMFTLAHELAHIWLGESGVSNVLTERIPDQQTERWCNQVAAEILVPLEDLKSNYSTENGIHSEMERLARRYKVSTLVILRRILDMREISEDAFWGIWHEEIERLKSFERRAGDGGDFYRTLGVRISKRFANGVVSSALEGQTLFRDAFNMLGIKKNTTFYELANKLGY